MERDLVPAVQQRRAVLRERDDQHLIAVAADGQRRARPARAPRKRRLQRAGRCAPRIGTVVQQHERLVRRAPRREPAHGLRAREDVAARVAEPRRPRTRQRGDHLAARQEDARAQRALLFVVRREVDARVVARDGRLELADRHGVLEQLDGAPSEQDAELGVDARADVGEPEGARPRQAARHLDEQRAGREQGHGEQGEQRGEERIPPRPADCARRPRRFAHRERRAAPDGRQVRRQGRGGDVALPRLLGERSAQHES